MEEELKSVFRIGIASRLADFAKDRGIRTVEELRTFLAGSRTKERGLYGVQLGLSPTYEFPHWVDLLMIPRFGRKTVSVVMKWATPEIYQARDQLKVDLADAQRKVLEAQDEVRKIREAIGELNLKTP